MDELQRVDQGDRRSSSGVETKVMDELDGAIEILRRKEKEEKSGVQWIVPLRKKLRHLQKACAKGFENSSLEASNSTSSGEEEQLKKLQFKRYVLPFKIYYMFTH